MGSPFSKDFDSIFHNVLTDYQNLDSAPDVSEGATAYIMGSVLSSGIWGLYRYLDNLSLQHFPDTADTENLNHHGVIYDVTRNPGDTDAEHLADILSFLRQPPAGGNNLDFQNWALDEENSFFVDGSTTYTNAYVTVVGQPDDIPGAVETFTIPSDESIIGTGNGESLRAATEAYIETKRSLGMLAQTVTESTETLQTVTMTVTAPPGGAVDTSGIKDAIIIEINGMVPGEDLFEATLFHIAKLYGADNVTISAPGADVSISNDNFARTNTGLVTVTEV